MPLQLVAADTIAGCADTDQTATDRDAGRTRRRSPLALLVGLFVLTTMLLVALAIVALTDDDETGDEVGDGPADGGGFVDRGAAIVGGSGYE